MTSRFARALLAVGMMVGLCALGTLHRGRESWVRGTAGVPGPVRILQFYSTSGFIKAGQTATLCYGVENAKSVRIAPLVEGVSPSTNRCLEVLPLHTTHYTILAEGFDGHLAMQSFTLPVEATPAANPRPLNYAGGEWLSPRSYGEPEAVRRVARLRDA